MTRRNQAPSLFIQKKKPPAQTSVVYSGERRAPTELDAGKIAQMDAVLEKRGTNTLKGPKSTIPTLDVAAAQKVHAAQKRAATSILTENTPKSLATEEEEPQNAVVGETEDDLQMGGMSQPLIAESKSESSAVVMERSPRPVVEQKTNVISEGIMQKTQKRGVEQKKDVPPKGTKEQAQWTNIAQEQDLTRNPVGNALWVEISKPEVDQKSVSRLRARTSAYVQMKGSWSRMGFSDTAAAYSPSKQAAEQPKTPMPLIDTELATIAASLPLPSSTIMIVPETLSQAAVPPPRPLSETASLTPLTASISHHLSSTEERPKTPREALTPLPTSPITKKTSTLPEALICRPESPVKECAKLAPEASAAQPTLQGMAVPQTPIRPAMVFPFTPETSINQAEPRSVYEHLDVTTTITNPFSKLPRSTLPPTPETAPSRATQLFLPTSSPGISSEIPELQSSYLSCPEVLDVAAVPPSAVLCARTTETPTSCTQIPTAQILPQILKARMPEPCKAVKQIVSGATFLKQTTRTASSDICPQFVPARPYSPEAPTTKSCNVGEPMVLSSSIYNMSPGRIIHETPELADFIMSCVPRNFDPLPAWEQYFNEHLANTISAFSANCRFEHPGANRHSSNPFSALSGGNNNNNRGGFGSQANPAANNFSLNKDTIYKDLTEDRPSWVLSAYGPGRDAPEQLWGGYPIEQSFEEARLHFYMGQMAGNPQGALNDIQGLENQVQQKVQTAIQNLDGAINFILQSQNNHPNRHDMCGQGSSQTTGEFAVGKRPVGLQTAANNNSPFGQPTAPSQQSNPFGGGSATSAFGQPLALGQTSAFGQPSTLGGGSAFGQPSTLGGNTGFGQPSALGQKPSPFGQPSALGASSSPFAQASGGTGFGQTSTLGQKPNPFGAPAQTSAFGQPAQSSGFGQTSTLNAKPNNPFGAAATGSSASPFGAFANNNNNHSAAQGSSPFGALGGTSNNAGGFGAPQQQNSTPFGQPQQTLNNEVSMDSAPTSVANSFANAGSAGASNPFGQPAQPSPAPANPFAQAAATPSPFGAPAATQPQQQANAPATTGATNPYGPNATRQHPPYNSYANKSPTGQLLSWKGKGVTYKQMDDERPVPGIQNFDGSWTKIWFPDGPPNYNKDTEPGRPYTEEEKMLYSNFANTGKFQLAATGGGGMPLAPPMREMCTWDF